MASVNFMKLHGGSKTKAIVRHCDKEQRSAQKNKANKQINSDLTGLNRQLKRSYADVCKMYDERIAWLDAQEEANKRKDRVTCFGLDVPVPEGLKESDTDSFFSKVCAIVGNQYGKANILQCYIHVDEIHDYMDAETKEKRTSRAHAHIFVIPEHNGKLNGKWFSSARNMRALNGAIHDMAMADYGVRFMDGSKRKSRKEVEELKNESRYLELESELKADYEKRSQMLDDRESNLNSRENALKAQEGAFKREKDEFAVEKQKTLKMANRTSELQKELKDGITEVNGYLSKLKQDEEAKRMQARMNVLARKFGNIDLSADNDQSYSR